MNFSNLMLRLRTRIVLGAVVAGTALLSACGPQGTPPATPAAKTPASAGVKTFRILAGSELKDVQTKVQEFGTSNGVQVSFDFTGSIDAVDKLGEAHGYDAVWVSHGKYLQLVPGVKEQVKAAEKTMYSRVVMGIAPVKLKELGWASGKVTWQQVTAAAKAGKFRFAMTNPAGSNTGFVTLVGVASELSGKGDALQESDIPDGKLKEFFTGLALTSGSSGDLAERYKADPSKVDGIVNYESVIIGLKQAGLPLEVVVPKEGVITADYPLMLLSQSKQADFYGKLVEFLRTDATQDWIAKNTHRTPLKGTGADEVTNELPFPGNLKVVDAILRGYLDSYTKPATSYFVLDVSGSMQGARMSDMKSSVGALAKGDGSVSGRFSTFRDREYVGMVAFSNVVSELNEFTLTKDSTNNRAALEAAGRFVDSLSANGGTAIYDALNSVYGRAQAALKAGDRTVSIVLLTDGENNNGISVKRFLEVVAQQGSPKVPVYVVLYGEANAAELKTVADATGGRVFDARKQSLKQVLKAIRTYQ